MAKDVMANPPTRCLLERIPKLETGFRKRSRPDLEERYRRAPGGSRRREVALPVSRRQRKRLWSASAAVPAARQSRSTHATLAEALAGWIDFAAREHCRGAKHLRSD